MNDQNTDDEKSVCDLPRRMADAIAEIKRRNGNCLPQDLNDVGFTPQQVIDNWDAARSLMEAKKVHRDWER